MKNLEWSHLWVSLIAIAATLLFVWLFSRDKHNKIRFETLLLWVQVHWYLLIVALSILFVIVNYPDCMDFEFFSDFKGDNLIFILSLILIVLPLFDKLEIFGISLKLRNNIINEAMNDAENSTPEMIDRTLLEELNKSNKEDE